MKETGIIMSSDHPRKILDGTKTMTRRVIKPQPPTGYHLPVNLTNDTWGFQKPSQGYLPHIIKCPYGQVGDRLWVREAFEYIDRTILFDAVKIRYSCDGQEVWSPTKEKWEYQGIDFKKMPSIFMPRWASRITLEITEVRVEKQLDITLEDAIKEGFGSEREFNEAFLRLNPHLKTENPWVWVISFQVVREK